MKKGTYLKRLILAISAACICSVGSLYAYEPTATLGVFAEQLIFPSAGRTGYLTDIQFSGLFGWSTRLGSGSYLNLSANGELNTYLYSNPVLSDREQLDLQVSAPFGSNRLDITAGLDASMLGTLVSPAYFNPDWQLKYRLERGRRKLRPYAAYVGYYLYQPDGTEDALYQGGEVGFLYNPSIRRGYQVGLEAGMENWTESYLFDAAGNPTQEGRRDVLVKVNGEVNGLLGFFLSWTLDGQAGLRWSNANRYVNLQLEDNSESSWFLYEEANISWSPHRQVDIQLGAFGRQELYLDRQALTSSGVLSGDPLRIISTGLNARLDWTPDDRLYLVATGEGSWRLANDPNEGRWNIAVGAGLEYGF